MGAKRAIAKTNLGTKSGIKGAKRAEEKRSLGEKSGIEGT